MTNDNESSRPYIEGSGGARVLAACQQLALGRDRADSFLTNNGVPVISGIDTRALVRHLRSRGVMRGVLSAISTAIAKELVERARKSPSMAGLDLATRVSTTEQLWVGPAVRSRARRRKLSAMPAEPRFHVVAYDFGIKRNILRPLVQSGCRVTVVPAGTSAEDVLALKPDGVFLSNGPAIPSR